MSSSVVRTPDDQKAWPDGRAAARGILFVLPWDVEALGGVNQVVLNLIRHTARDDGLRGVLLENVWDRREAATVESTGIPILRMRLRSPCSASNPVRSLVSFLFELPISLFKIYRIVRQNGIGMINVHYPSPRALQFVALKMIGLFEGRLVLSVHGQDVVNASQSTGFSARCWRLLLRRADRIVACSRALAQQVESFDPEVTDRITVIHNGIDRDALDAEALKSGRSEPNLPVNLQNRRYIVSVGTFEYKKGQDVLIEAFRMVSDELADCHLVLIGRSGETVQGLRRQVTACALDSKVHLYEDVPHDHVSTFLRNASLFCLPSRIEPFGIALLEAGLCCIPVIASRVGGIPEIIEDGLHGRLVTPDEPLELANALREVLMDAAAAARYARNFSSRVKKHFSWERAFREYIALMDEP